MFSFILIVFRIAILIAAIATGLCAVKNLLQLTDGKFILTATSISLYMTGTTHIGLSALHILFNSGSPSVLSKNIVPSLRNTYNSPYNMTAVEIIIACVDFVLSVRIPRSGVGVSSIVTRDAMPRISNVCVGLKALFLCPYVLYLVGLSL